VLSLRQTAASCINHISILFLVFLHGEMEKHFPYLLVLLFSLASVFYSCKKDSSGSGGGASVLSHVTSYKMFQDTSLYESWVNTYTGNLLTETMSKVNYTGSILHFKTNIEYNANRVSGIYSYDSTGTGWIKGYDVVVTSWSAEGLPAEIINTFYEASGDIHQQNITQFTYNGLQVSEKNTIASTGEYNLWQYTYEPGQGNIRQVFEIGNAYETWNGNPDPYPSNPGKAKSKPLARDEIHLYY